MTASPTGCASHLARSLNSNTRLATALYSPLPSGLAGGRMSATEAMKIIGAGLRGGGTAITDQEVGALQADGGAAGYVDIVSRLLAASFGG